MSATLTIRVPAEEKARWEQAAAAAKESVAEYVRGAVRQRAQAASQKVYRRRGRHAIPLLTPNAS